MSAARRRSRVVWAAATAAALTGAWRVLGFAGFNNDHYVHVSRAYQLLLGDLPVRDFEDPGMPLMYGVHALARALFGPAVGVELGVVAIGFAVGAACTVIAAERLSRSLGVALIVSALEVLLNPRSFGYPKILVYAAAVLVIMGAARRGFTPRWLWALAATTAAAFLFRHDHGLFVGAASFVAVVIGGPSGWSTAARRGLVFAGMVLVVLAPWALFVQAHVGLAGYVRAALEFSRGEAEGNALRALPAFQWSDPTGLGSALAWLFYLFHLLPLAAAVVLIGRVRREGWTADATAVAAVIALAVPINLTFLRGYLDGRVADAAVPAALLGSWLCGLALQPDERFRLARVAMAGVLVAMTAGAVWRAASVDEQFARTRIPEGPRVLGLRVADLWDRLGRRVPDGDHVPSRYARALLPFAAYVQRCTAPDDRLLVTGLAPEVAVIAGRGFAGGHMAYLPEVYTSEAAQALTIARLERESVPLVVNLRRWEPRLRERMARVLAYLDARYVHMAEVPVAETDGAELLVERTRLDGPVDAATGWPCFR